MSDLEAGSPPKPFRITADQLVHLIEDRKLKWLEDQGGVSGLAEKLRSSVTDGLSGDELRLGLEKRIQQYGVNKFKYPPPKNFLRLILEAFKDLTIVILSVAAVISLIIGSAMEERRKEFGYLEGLAIVLVVVVVVLVQASIDYQKELKFRQLNSVKDNYDVQAKRAGQAAAIPAEELTVGDIIKVCQGDKLPADCILVQGSNLRTDESAMTGEVIEVHKNSDKDPFLLSGTVVSEGVGHAMVVAVGERSQWGLILAGLTLEPEDTPLQNRLDKLAWTIGKIGIAMAALTFLASMIRWVIDSASVGNWDALRILDFFIDAVTIVVVAIPEGLPLAITLGLAFAMRKMMKDKNLVRRLEACETMGSATQLNADKTGTLTQNRMTVVEAYFAGEKFDFEHNPDDLKSDKLKPEFRELVATSIAVNTQANLEAKPDGTVDHLGSKTECALLQLAENWGFSYTKLRRQNPTTRIWLFDSERKRMSSTSALPDSLASRLHCKGAPEIVLPFCTKALKGDGKSKVPLDDASRQTVLDQVEKMASRGLRTLLLCYRDINVDIKDETFWGKEAPEKDLIYLGIVGIKDPVRPETKETVQLLKGAGVTVRMVTGDNPSTARFIAKEAGILDDSGCVIEGPTFRKMDAEELDKTAKSIQVLARSTPTDKLKLVRAHKRLGEVVSVTGDGTNDAPALKEADVGFALGLAGTEIAKEACDIVIMDDNIKSMAAAVLWGRNVYQSIRKFLQFQLVVNVVAVTLNFISACAGVPLPLGAVPLLWVNMIMDSMGALALATEPPRRDLMKRKPFGRHAPLISRGMYRNIIGISIYQLAVCLVLEFAGKSIFNIECVPLPRGNQDDPCGAGNLENNSIIFNSFVFMQIFSEVNSRRIEERNIFSRIHKSYYFISIIVFTVGAQVAIMLGLRDTSLGDKIGVGTISGPAWALCLGLGLLIWPVGYVVRLWPLDWCVGPTDEDPLEMSKLEQLLKFPKRKPYVPPPSEEEQGIMDGIAPISLGEDDLLISGESETAALRRSASESEPSRQRSSAALHPRARIRVFVHAVAFINTLERRVNGDHPGCQPSGNFRSPVDL